MEAATKVKVEETVLEILRNADIQEMTEFQVRKLAGDKLGIDLSETSLKKFVRQIVQDFIQAQIQQQQNDAAEGGGGAAEDEEDVEEEEEEEEKESNKRRSDGKEYDDEGDLIVCPLSEKRRVTIQDFRGKTLASIREYYKKDRKYFPSFKDWLANMDDLSGEDFLQQLVEYDAHGQFSSFANRPCVASTTPVTHETTVDQSHLHPSNPPSTDIQHDVIDDQITLDPPPLHQSNPKRVKKKGVGKGKGSFRGPSKGVSDKKGPMYLEFDAYGQACGEWRLEYGKHVGICIRKLNINWEWANVDEGLKETMWQDTRNLFHIPEDKRLRKNFMAKVAHRFGDFKSKLVSGWITKTRIPAQFKNLNPPQIWNNITETDWISFKKAKLGSEAMEKRAKAVENAKKNEHPHHLGNKTYAEARVRWIKDGFYPSASTSLSLSGDSSDVTVEVNRGDDWYCSKFAMDSKTGTRSIPKESTRVVAENYLKFREAEAKGEFVPNRHKDALYMALGEKRDHLGRVKGFGGVNIGYRKAFGKPPPRIPMLGSSGPTPEEYASILSKMREEITLSVQEEITSRVREELNAEFDIKLSQSLAKVLDEKGINSFGFSIPVHPQHDPMELDSRDLEILPPTMMKNPKCRLYLPDDNSGKVIQVAQGYVKTNLAYNNSHNRERLKNHTIVCLEVVMCGFNNVKLPVAVSDFDGDELQHAKGSFVQWPSRWVRYHDEAISYIEKFKELDVEGRGSNFMSSRAPDGTPISHLSLDKNLPMNCSTLRGMLKNVENKLIAVTLDVGLFHYEGETADAGLSKDDVEQLFNNKKLAVPVIHTFMRTLQEDLLNLELVPKVGWLCPQTTSDTWVKEHPFDSGKYIERAIRESVEKRGAQYILAPIIQEGHWTLLVICPFEGIVYLFDPTKPPKMRGLIVATLIDKGLKSFQYFTGSRKRTKPLWKSVECAQQEGDRECGYFIMKYMFDVVHNCIDSKDVAQLVQKHRLHAFNKEEIDEMREKFAKFVIEDCMP